ncbi:transcriptional regulator [Dietzia sp. WMMA184]|uniref:transcriptional regulator n=2 Tax=Dietzia sp. WMMA184 TaxID=2039808 RepID=UPI0011785155|nr:transcriptional regulator [Dietzia sp. WMMA184]MDI6872439.1 transcriptional regulator [Bacillota bacterium]
MTAERSDSWQSREELLVLHGVRLAGFADTEAVADRVDLPVSIVGDTLCVLNRQYLIERMTFADSGGWILTEAGKCRDGELLQEELEASGARLVLQATADNFETSVNPRLVRAVTDWQLRSSAERTERGVEVLLELTALADALSDLMAGLVGRLPRFSRYPRQFSAALHKARAGDHQWVAGVGRLSCHIVWAELHEDLLSSLGRDRSAEPHQGGR